MWRTFSYTDESGKPIRHLQVERQEQILAEQYVLPSDCVLELGARYGTVSCATNAVLSCKTDHVVVEPDARVWTALETNKERNGGQFHIIKGFCSRKKLTLYDMNNWDGYGTKSQEDPTSNLPCFTVEDLEELVGKKFTCLIADCEGFLGQFLFENPTFLDSLRMILFEKDNPLQCDYKIIKEELKEKGFVQQVSLFREVWARPSAEKSCYLESTAE